MTTVSLIVMLGMKMSIIFAHSYTVNNIKKGILRLFLYRYIPYMLLPFLIVYSLLQAAVC